MALRVIKSVIKSGLSCQEMDYFLGQEGDANSLTFILPTIKFILEWDEGQ